MMSNYIFATSLDQITGCLFKKLREFNKLSQGNVDDVTTIPTSTLSKIELGKMNINIDFIFILCTFYKIQPSDFFKIIENSLTILTEKKVYIYTDKTFDAFKIKEELTISGLSDKLYPTQSSIKFVPSTGTMLPPNRKLESIIFLNKKELYKSTLTLEPNDKSGMESIGLPILSVKQLASFMEKAFDNFNIPLLTDEDKQSYLDYLT